MQKHLDVAALLTPLGRVERHRALDREPIGKLLEEDGSDADNGAVAGGAVRVVEDFKLELGTGEETLELTRPHWRLNRERLKRKLRTLTLVIQKENATDTERVIYCIELSKRKLGSDI